MCSRSQSRDKTACHDPAAGCEAFRRSRCTARQPIAKRIDRPNTPTSQAMTSHGKAVEMRSSQGVADGAAAIVGETARFSLLIAGVSAAGASLRSSSGHTEPARDASYDATGRLRLPVALSWPVASS